MLQLKFQPVVSQRDQMTVKVALKVEADVADVAEEDVVVLSSAKVVAESSNLDN